MGWLNLVVGAANVAMNASQLQKMNEFGQIQQVGAVIEIVRNQMRDYIFRINQAKEDLLPYLEHHPVAVATGLRYLELELQSSGLKPESFSELSDKEYFATTQRSIQHDFLKVYELVPEQQKDTIEITVEAMITIDDLAYLVNNYSQVTALQNAQNDFAELEQNKPGMFAFSQQGEWNRQHIKKRQEVAQLVQLVDLEKFQELANHYHLTTQDACQEQYNIASEMIASVFTNVPVPQLQDNMDDSVVNSPALDSVIADSDRKECHKCGHLNSKHRVTCKNCQIPLT